MADRVNVNALVQCLHSLLCGLLCREASPLKVAPTLGTFSVPKILIRLPEPISGSHHH
jgi:hypothetical protein